MDVTNTKNTRFFHHADLSGDVRILLKKTDQELTIPGDDLKSFMVEYIRTEKISKLEDASDVEILGL